ncbi:hypothetical protein Scep_007341 [Stephania cephalantha]|uniref:Uncharacterized protein n=1 Tax=Stephania cephalantha TaxID=152367 RepID=A0AAP0PN56_9MAGN
MRGSRIEPITSVHVLAVQSQALFNIKDSNKNDFMMYFREDLHRWLLSPDFKKKAREMDNRREGKPGEARAALRRSVRDNGARKVDDEAVYYKVAGECPKGRVYGLGSLGRKKRKYADADASTSQVLAQRGMGGMGNFMILRYVGAGSSQPISANNEPIELLRKDIKEMLTKLLLVIQDNTLDRDQLREMHGQLGRMKQTLMVILWILFAPPRDVPADSETDDDRDN